MAIKKIDLEALAEKFAKENMTAIFEQINYYEDKHGKGFGEQLYATVIAAIVGARLYKTLTEAGKEKGKTSAAFIRLKHKTEEAVVAGIQGSIEILTGKEVEYVCRIEPVPPVVSKLSH